LSVVDASVVVDAFAADKAAGDAARRILATQRRPDAPQILKAESASALRSMELRGATTPHRARWALESLRRLPTRPHPIEPLLGRIWELRNTLTVYDAWYVALAERLGTTLFTADRRLAEAPGPRCEITLVTAA